MYSARKPALRLIALVFAAIAVIGKAAAQAPLAVVPYTVEEDGALIVEARVNGAGPYDFIIDTGATLTLAFDNLRLSENLKPTGAANKRIIGLSGAEEHPTYFIGDIELGGAVLADHVGAVLPDWGAPRKTPAGILGVDFLKRFAIVADVKARTLSLYPAGAPPQSKIGRWRRAPLSPISLNAGSEALYAVSGRVDRKSGRFIIDLGLSTTLINYTFAEAIFADRLSVGDWASRYTGTRVKDVFDDRTLLSTTKLRTLSIEGKRWSRPVVLVFNAPLFGEFGLQARPVGLLGADLIARQDFALDIGAGAIYFARE